MNAPEQFISPVTFRSFAKWIAENGIEEALMAIVLVLVFLYFLKMIFRPSQESLLHEIKELLIEIKAFLIGEKK
jgi:hypothetical protein